MSSQETVGVFEPSGNTFRRALKNRAFLTLCLAVTSLTVLTLAVLMISIFLDGFSHLDKDFLTSFASRKPAEAGFKAAMWGSIFLLIVCSAVAIPLGVGAAIYLEEFAPRNRVTGFIRLNITNLAGVPSIVYGIIGLTVFGRMFGLFGTELDPAVELGQPDSWLYFRLPFGSSVLAGGLTLMLVILPVIIIATQEALRAVPNSLREGALAQGATQWEMVWKMTLPAAVPGIMTGAILSMSRAIGEAAPLLVVGGLLFITFTPSNFFDDFAAMPLQIYNWAGRPQAEFHNVAASGIIVLLAILLTFNALAIFIRQKLQKPLS